MVFFCIIIKNDILHRLGSSDTDEWECKTENVYIAFNKASVRISSVDTGATPSVYHSLPCSCVQSFDGPNVPIDINNLCHVKRLC